MSPLNPDMFVEVWERSKSVDEVLKTLQKKRGMHDLTEQKIFCMAWSLRRFGVKLKKLPRCEGATYSPYYLKMLIQPAWDLWDKFLIIHKPHQLSSPFLNADQLNPILRPGEPFSNN